MMAAKNGFILCILVLMLFKSSGQTTFIIQSEEEYDISTFFQVYEENGEQNIHDLFESTLFSAADEIVFQSESAYWLKAECINRSENSQWAIVLPFQTTTHGELYLKQGSNVIGPMYQGIFQKRNGNDAFLSLGEKFIYQPITIAQNVPTQVLVKLKNDKHNLVIDSKVLLKPFNKEFIKSQNNIAAWMSIFTGFLGIAILLTFILGWSTRDRSYSMYGFYLFFLLLWATFSNGLLRNWLLDNITFLSPKYFFLLRSAGILTFGYYFRFIIEFGRLDKYFKWLSWLRFKAIPLAWALTFLDWGVLLFFEFNFVYSNMVEMVSVFSWLVFNIIMLPKLWKIRDKPYVQLIFNAMCILCLAILILIVRLIFNDFRSIHAPETFIATAIELVIFSYGLSLKLTDHIRLKSENETIKTLLAEKETLLKEIHHRVKNNLQVISSLLRIQSHQTEDEVAVDALKDSQSRVQSMSMIHQDLYQNKNLTKVNMKDYLERLTRSLFDTYNISEDKVSLVIDIDDIELDVDTVVPLGLIINELVTNSLKYAFPEDRIGRVIVSLKDEKTELVMTVRDDGIGIQNDQETTSFGQGLIKAFAHKLESEIEMKSEKGTEVYLKLKKDYVTNS